MAFDEEKGGGGQNPPNIEALIKKVLSDEESRKKQQAQIDKIENNVRIIGNLICKDGVCTLATKEDLAKVSKEQMPRDDLSQFSGQELWNQIKKSERNTKDVGKIHLTKLKEDQDYLKEALGDKELVGKMVTLLCDDSGCRLVFNEEVDKAHKAGKGKGQKESWLIKKK